MSGTTTRLQTTAPADEELLKERSKRISIKEACAYSFMDGFGLVYMTPYAVALGATNAQIGFLASLPSLLGTLSQLLTLRAMRHWTRKKISVIGVGVQAACWPLILVIGALYYGGFFSATASAWAIIGLYTFMILSGAFAGPAWSSWMKDVVGGNLGAYFSRRNRIAGAVSLFAMVTAGLLLDRFKQSGHEFVGFSLLFCIAFAGRTVSTFLLTRQYEPHFKTDESAFFTFPQFLKKMPYNNFGRYVIYVSLLTLATSIGGPFTLVYMLKDLHFNYTQYMAVILAGAAITFLLLPMWGRFTDRYGSIRTIRFSGMLMPLIPLLWVFCYFLEGFSTWHLTAYLVFAQLVGGAVWAGFQLAAGNFIYEAVTRQRMAICMSYFSIINGAGALLGASLGGWISSLPLHPFGVKMVIWVFAISALARGLVYVIMIGRIREVRPVEMFTLGDAHAAVISPSLREYSETFKFNFLRRRWP